MKKETLDTFGNQSGNQNSHGRRSVHFLFQVSVIGLVCCALGVATFQSLADDPPVLTIAPLGGGVFSITVTNAASPTNYLLEWTPVLADTNYPWLVVATNAPGETNWVMDMKAWHIGFLRVMVGRDGDGDSVPSWMDANPLDASVGVLSVTIDSPLSGDVLN